jgi:hypothetical protein
VNVSVSQLYAFGVPSCTRGITENWAVTLSAFLKCNISGGSTRIHNFLIGVELNTMSFAISSILCIDVIEADSVFNRASDSFLLHLDDFLDVIHCAEKSSKLGLLQDVVNSLEAHRVEETDRCVVHVHVGDVGYGPLPSILGPNSGELPFAAITLRCVRELQLAHTSSQVLGVSFDLLIVHPLVIAKFLNILSFDNLHRQSFSCPEVGVVRACLDMLLKKVQEGVIGSNWQVIVIFRINFDTNELC